MQNARHSYRLLLDGNDWRINGRRSNEWIWARSYDREPTTADWYPATVPGSVQDDLLDQGRIPDPDFELNSRECEWTSDRDWTYQKTFTILADASPGSDARWVLRFHGVDYRCHVFLNGQKLGGNEGTFIPFELDATSVLKVGGEPNRLAVVVERAPDEQFQIGYTSKVRTWKPRFAYGWDWCTRLVPLGIWKSVELIRDDGLRILDLWARPSVAADGVSGRVDATVRLSALREMDVELCGTVLQSGAVVAESRVMQHVQAGTRDVEFGLDVAPVELWWPNGHGAQPLYGIEVAAAGPGCGDASSVRIGFRTFRMVPNEDAPADALPYTVEVNGKRIYIKGWNWAPTHHLYRRQTPERYRRLIELAREAHVTFLRVWGGGLLEREVFYDLCDEAGILVWQSFSQSSSGIDNEPPKDPEYMNLAVRHAEAMVPQRRNHPSLVIWCGGNELMDDGWKPLGLTHPTLAVLKDCVARLDPDRFYLPTSASGPVANASLEQVGRMHDVHGPWTYNGLEEHYRLFNGIDPLLHAEFGSEGAARLRSLRAFLAEDHLWPPDATNEMWLHHGAWWINRARAEAFFGPIADIRAFVLATQFIQAEGLRYSIEANRRRKWHCSGTMPWQYNETWPNASGNYCVDYYGQPRPAYYLVRNAHRPLHVSAAYDAIARRTRGDVRCALFAHNSHNGERPVEIVTRLVDACGRELATSAFESVAGGNATTAIGEFRWQAPSGFEGVVLLRLELLDAGAPVSRNEYVFSFAEAPELAPLLALPPAHVAAERQADRVVLRNEGETVAFFVSLEPAANDDWIVLSDSYFCLLPDETQVVAIRGKRCDIAVEGFNVAETIV